MKEYSVSLYTVGISRMWTRYKNAIFGIDCIQPNQKIFNQIVCAWCLGRNHFSNRGNNSTRVVFQDTCAIHNKLWGGLNPDTVQGKTSLERIWEAWANKVDEPPRWIDIELVSISFQSLRSSTRLHGIISKLTLTIRSAGKAHFGTHHTRCHEQREKS